VLIPVSWGHSVSPVMLVSLLYNIISIFP
jgi:hypothetical protein